MLGSSVHDDKKVPLNKGCIEQTESFRRDGHDDNVHILLCVGLVPEVSGNVLDEGIGLVRLVLGHA